MADENQTENVPETTQQQPPSAPPAPPAAAQPPAEPKQVTMPSNTIAAIRKEEREKGKKAAQNEMNARAKALGYKSWEDFEAAEKARKAGGGKKKPEGSQAQKPAAQAGAQPNDADDSTTRRLQRELARKDEEIARLRRQLANADRRRKMAERGLASTSAEVTLREAAVRAGVTDVDYALHRLRREMQGKSAEDLAAFDEAKWFEGLRKTAPHLFGVERQPANTGNGGGTPGAKPAAPKAPEVSQGNSANGKIDARKMSRDEYAARLAELGLTNPSHF